MARVVSIDRVPPMEDARHHPNLLVAPKTDFQHGASPKEFDSHGRPPVSTDLETLQQELAQETEWRGLTLRKIREVKRVPLEELAEYTKISRTYILAIEEENFAKLPAPVFLRGFVIQIAKYLKLPHEAVASAYMARRMAFDKKTS
jgi:hypothetical protein